MRRSKAHLEMTGAINLSAYFVTINGIVPKNITDPIIAVNKIKYANMGAAAFVSVIFATPASAEKVGTKTRPQIAAIMPTK